VHLTFGLAQRAFLEGHVYLINSGFIFLAVDGLSVTGLRSSSPVVALSSMTALAMTALFLHAVVALSLSCVWGVVSLSGQLCLS
jgi:hypothetical protein